MNRSLCAGAVGFQGFSQWTPWLTTYQNDGVTPWARLSDPGPDVGPKLPYRAVRPTSLVRRDAHEVRESLPMPWMRQVSTGANLCRVRFGDAQGRC